MKKAIFAFAVLFSSYNVISSPLKEAPVVVLNTSHDIFYFKICKTMVGGIAEVFDASGNLVTTQTMDKCRLIIDFFDMTPGDYTIKLKKESTEETFTYHRNDHSLPLNVSEMLMSTEAPGK